MRGSCPVELASVGLDEEVEGLWLRFGEVLLAGMIILERAALGGAGLTFTLTFIPVLVTLMVLLKLPARAT